MLWIKALHLIAVTAWLAGLFYLPRIFVHYAEGRAAGEDVRRLVVMAPQNYPGQLARAERHNQPAALPHAMPQRFRQRVSESLVERHRQADIAKKGHRLSG